MNDFIEDAIAAIYKTKFDLMKKFLSASWESKPLGVIVQRPIFAGTNDYRGGNAEALLITPEAVSSLKFEAGMCNKISIGKHSHENAVSGGDIVFVLRGAYAGTSAIIPIFSEGGLVGGDCAGISVNSAIADPFFVVNVLHFHYRNVFFEAFRDASGTISLEVLEMLHIPLPDVETQKKISLVLLELSRAIEHINNV
jgi:restriction endonuclease S subunit